MTSLTEKTTKKIKDAIYDANPEFCQQPFDNWFNGVITNELVRAMNTVPNEDGAIPNPLSFVQQGLREFGDRFDVEPGLTGGYDINPSLCKEVFYLAAGAVEEKARKMPLFLVMDYAREATPAGMSR